MANADRETRSTDGSPESTRSTDTAPTYASERTLRRSRGVRRVVIAALAVFVALGAMGVFGVKAGGVSASGGGYDLTVIYPAVARPGLAIGWEVRLHHAGGFQGPVTVATTLGYFDMFDFNNLQALPSSVTNQGNLAVWELDPPEGDTLIVKLDARLSPAVQKGRGAVTEVLVRGVPVVSVRYETRVMP